MPRATQTAPTPAPLEGAGNLAGLLSAAAERWPERCALVHDSQQLTLRRARAPQPARGAVPAQAAASSRVTGSACRRATRSRLSSLYFGILRLGAIVVPQNPLATPA